jgi:hypothetical protein
MKMTQTQKMTHNAKNIAILSHSIAILISRSEQFASDANKLQVEIHKRFVNKASDWTISKKEANQIV